MGVFLGLGNGFSISGLNVSGFWCEKSLILFPFLDWLSMWKGQVQWVLIGIHVGSICLSFSIVVISVSNLFVLCSCLSGNFQLFIIYGFAETLVMVLVFLFSQLILYHFNCVLFLV